MKIIITESQYNLLFETKSVNAAQTLIDMAVEDYVDACGKMKAFENIQLALCKGFENGTVKLEVTSVEKKENDRFEDNIFYVIHLILYVDKEWMLENSYYEKFETTLGIKIGNFLGTFEYYCYIDEVRMNDDLKDNLTEEQFKNLFESKEEKKSDLLYSMWMEGMSMDDIKDYTGMNMQQIISYLKNREINIDCKFAEKLVITLIRNTDFINKNYNINDGQMTLNLTCSGYDGTVDFEFHTKEYMLKGMATPYWGGECNTPVDGSYFENKKTDEYTDEYDNLGKHIENTPSSFKSIQEIIDFLNNDYPKQLIEPIIEIIEYHS